MIREAVSYALHSMEMEGLSFTPAERQLWAKIAAGELPLEAAREDARKFDQQMRELHPEKFGKKLWELNDEELDSLMKEVGQKAIKETHAAGRPSVHSDEEGIYYLHKDGRKEKKRK